MEHITINDNALVIKPRKSKLMMLAGKYNTYAKNLPVPLDRIRDTIDYSNRKDVYPHTHQA